MKSHILNLSLFATDSVPWENKQANNNEKKINNKKKCPHKIYSRQIMSKKTSVLLIIAVAFAFLLYPTVGFKGLGKQPV